MGGGAGGGSQGRGGTQTPWRQMKRGMGKCQKDTQQLKKKVFLCHVNDFSQNNNAVSSGIFRLSAVVKICTTALQKIPIKCNILQINDNLKLVGADPSTLEKLFQTKSHTKDSNT